jgi:conjugative relaxase-like TrwC/TraI family protein
VVAVMTVHKLTAGDGYTYLTRQVASCDEVRPQGQSLADYYAARGNPPGVWLGKGAAQLGVREQQVNEAQMRALFGAGLHPDAEAMLAAGATNAPIRLGRQFPVYGDLAPYAQRVAEKTEEFTSSHGRPPSAAERHQIAAKEAHRGRRAVAGFDLVFTPVKSASVLWGLSSPEVRGQVEDAHHAAVTSALTWVEQHASYTRTGRGGVAQVDATGLICAAFDHRESRSGDPDLHTHVAIANKVCGPDGRWRSLDARGLFALGVAASERYNTRFEDELSSRLGVLFEDRADGSPDKRPVREVVGIPRKLVGHFSRRRAAIAARLDELTAEYRDRHGREPDHATSIHLAQQATMETREGKPPGRTFAEQVTDWRQQATEILGGAALDRALDASIGREVPTVTMNEELVRDAARQVVREVSERRSTWTLWNAYAETERILRPLRFASAPEREDLTRAVVRRATGPELSIRIAEPELIAETPSLIRPSDGQSVFVTHGSKRFTTSSVLVAEDSLVAAGRSGDADHCEDLVVQAALAIHESRSRQDHRNAGVHRRLGGQRWPRRTPGDLGQSCPGPRPSAGAAV